MKKLQLVAHILSKGENEKVYPLYVTLDVSLLKKYLKHRKLLKICFTCLLPPSKSDISPALSCCQQSL